MGKSIVLLPKGFGDSFINDIQVLSEDKVIETTNGAYDELFAKCGSWASWINHIAIGQDYLSRKPIYDKFYCVTDTLGRANADILEKALKAGKECFFFDGTDLQEIVAVHQESDDWTNGWRISYI